MAVAVVETAGDIAAVEVVIAADIAAVETVTVAAGTTTRLSPTINESPDLFGALSLIDVKRC